MAKRNRGATTLLRRLQHTHAAYTAVRPLLPATPEAADTLESYQLTHQSVQQFIVNTHTEWFATIDPSLSTKLQAPLLVQDKADGGPWLLACGLFSRGCVSLNQADSRRRHTITALKSSALKLSTPKPQTQTPNQTPNPNPTPTRPGGLLSVNFARELLSMSAEVVQWERLRMAVPYVAMEIQAQRNKYRAMREHALALVGTAWFGFALGWVQW